MKRLLALLAMVLLMGLSQIAAQDIRYNFDKNTDFSRFKTYEWVTIKDAGQLDSLRDKQVKAAVEAELAQRGLRRVEGETADLFIGYQAAIGQEKEFTSFSSGWGYGAGWYGGGWYGYPGGGMTTGQTSTIYTGQLAIDMYDPANKDLVWRGVASKTLDRKAKPDKQQKNLTKAVAKLFKNYPPKPKS